MPSSKSPRGKSPSQLTLAVITYNQEEFVEQAVRGALSQSYSPLQIVLSDDASSDRTFEVLQRSVVAYGGPHEVVLNRNDRNLGLAGNVNRVMEMATGEVILLAGGDDVSMPHRAERSMQALEANRDCISVSFGTISFSGREIPIVSQAQPSMLCTRYTRREYVASPSFHLNGASRAFRRQAFDFFGPIALECPTEDTVILLRCLLLGNVLGTPEPQVHYRVHGANLSGADNEHRIDAVEIHRQYLRDVTVAVEHGLLTTDEAMSLRRTLDLRLTRRTLQRDLNLAPKPAGVFFRSIAGSKAFGRREKLRMFRAVLERRRL